MESNFTLKVANYLAIFMSLIQFTFASICMENFCEFELVVTQRRSMTYTMPDGAKTFNVAWNESAKRLQIAENAYHRKENEPLIGKFLNDNDVITVDGFTKNIFVINGEFPGPTLEVREGAEVSVKVINKLGNQGLTIHFHGISFKNNVWMDGAAYISQCPIQPGQSFEYRFVATPAGTRWYHSHFGFSRLDGIFGAFIVHKQEPEVPYHVVTVNDWYHEDGNTIRIMNPFHAVFKGTGEAILPVPQRDYSVDGVQLSAYAHDSTLIGGRGRLDGITDLLPLVTYDVASNTEHRFRVVHTGTEFTYEIIVDMHKLKLVAMDGYDINEITADSFIISPSERVDFVIKTNQAVKKYWIRAEIIRQGTTFQVVEDGITKGGKAILRYMGTSGDGDPSSFKRTCTAENPCVVANCPYGGYKSNQYKTCISLNDIQSAESVRYLQHYGIDDDDVEEYFLNTAFNIGSSVNARKFYYPTAPFSGPNQNNIIKCDDVDCNNGCICTNILHIPFNKTIQLVLSNLQPNANIMAHHGIHVHGHSFAVMAVGFPSYDVITGLWEEANGDVVCNSDLCTHPAWNTSRSTFLRDNPVIKDTVVVPARGYVVIRFRSNNPGYWLIHCHQESHFADGMALLINEGQGHHPPVPRNFPTCADYAWIGNDSPHTTQATHKPCPPFSAGVAQTRMMESNILCITLLYFSSILYN